MKLVQLIGILCILAGGYVLIRGFTYTKQESVIEVGDLKAGFQEKKSVPPLGGRVGDRGRYRPHRDRRARETVTMRVSS